MRAGTRSVGVGFRRADWVVGLYGFLPEDLVSIQQYCWRHSDGARSQGQLGRGRDFCVATLRKQTVDSPRLRPGPAIGGERVSVIAAFRARRSLCCAVLRWRSRLPRRQGWRRVVTQYRGARRTAERSVGRESVELLMQRSGYELPTVARRLSRENARAGGTRARPLAKRPPPPRGSRRRRVSLRRHD